MPLSEYEQRVLEQMERQLTSDDPKLVHTLQGGSSSLRRWLLTGVGFLAGLGGLIAGTATSNAVLGVLGFVVMFLCVVLAFSPPRHRGPTGTVKADGSVKPRKGPSRMQRLEDRWDRRRDEPGR
jgi:hypothetical protein